VPAVQAAVDQGGTVLLQGHFSFDEAPTKLIAPSFIGSAGAGVRARGRGVEGRDHLERAKPATNDTIDAGTIPFYVDAPGER
jgi:hypothetical protein